MTKRLLDADTILQQAKPRWDDDLPEPVTAPHVIQEVQR
jgi:hypothetical protein